MKYDSIHPKSNHGNKYKVSKKELPSIVYKVRSQSMQGGNGMTHNFFILIQKYICHKASKFTSCSMEWTHLFYDPSYASSFSNPSTSLLNKMSPTFIPQLTFRMSYVRCFHLFSKTIFFSFKTIICCQGLIQLERGNGLIIYYNIGWIDIPLQIFIGLNEIEMDGFKSFISFFALIWIIWYHSFLFLVLLMLKEFNWFVIFLIDGVRCY